MLELPPLEKYLFAGILILSTVSSVLAHLQIVRDQRRYGRSVTAVASMQIIFSVILLILRAVDIQAFPITGVFESMLILVVFIGITFLLLSVYVHQIWFVSVMAWALFVLTLLAAVVARPASVLQEAARTPWVIVHALCMALSGAMIVFSAAMSTLYLWSRKRLKSSRFSALFGKMPTLENLERLNLLGLRLSFIVMSFGLVSGVGMVAVKSAGLGMTVGDWLTDSKIVLIAIAWVVILSVLILRTLLVFSGRTLAQATLFICFLVLFAFIGSTVFCKSSHDFVSPSGQLESTGELFLCKLF